MSEPTHSSTRTLALSLSQNPTSTAPYETVLAGRPAQAGAREAQNETDKREFRIGDRVYVRHGSLVEGRIGRIGRKAHPATPWRWVVYSEPGDTFWGTAVNDEDITHVEAHDER